MTDYYLLKKEIAYAAILKASLWFVPVHYRGESGIYFAGNMEFKSEQDARTFVLLLADHDEIIATSSGTFRLKMNIDENTIVVNEYGQIGTIKEFRQKFEAKNESNTIN